MGVGWGPRVACMVPRAVSCQAGPAPAFRQANLATQGCKQAPQPYPSWAFLLLQGSSGPPLTLLSPHPGVPEAMQVPV